ncbi:MAG: 16S rRNA (guanine(966)-N(2))-methyltransferase RsmD [Ruminococcaceae bacterium]|nr:16S rRNA (guanine(966)-N(2))-methyltransferase RsmD [Oscillospiraceae bacterium]
MRVIAGIRRGLKLADFEGENIRPTTDRVRENIFNIISPYVPDADVLDMFAGTGAFSIEAISRGAKSSVLCELSQNSGSVAKKNIDKADFNDSCTIRYGDCIKYVLGTDKKFDIIFLDPPYNTGLLMKALGAVSKSGVLADEGIVIVECDNTEKPDSIEALELVKEKRYGRTYILIYKPKN